MVRKILVGVVLTTLTACGGKGSDSQTAAADSLKRDLQLAPAESTAQLNDQPAAPAPKPATPAPTPTARAPPKPAPKPAPAPAAPAGVTLKGGTSITALSDDSLHSRRDKAGQTITATVGDPIRDASGKIGIPSGAVITFKVLKLEPAKNKKAKDGEIELQATEVSINGKTYTLNAVTREVEHTLQGQGVTAGGAARVAGGAAVGAIAGKVIGGKTGAIVGGVVGAGAGTVAAVESADRDVVVAPGNKIVIELVGDMTIK